MTEQNDTSYENGGRYGRLLLRAKLRCWAKCAASMLARRCIAVDLRSRRLALLIILLFDVRAGAGVLGNDGRLAYSLDILLRSSSR